MNYDMLLDEANAEGLTVHERPFSTYDGRIKGKNIYLRCNMNTVQKADVLAEELGHHFTSVGDIIDLSEAQNRKQERQARLWAYNKRIGLHGIIRAYEAGCTSRYEVAEFLEVTEEFLEDAIQCYRDKYGTCVSVENHTIYFIPQLIVLKKI